MTRDAVSKQKSLQSALMTLCTTLFEGAKTLNPETDSDRATASYTKLTEYRTKLKEIGENILEAATSDSSKDFIEIETIDTQCLGWIEKLFHMIPSDHPLRKVTTPIHMREMRDAGARGGQAEQGSDPKKSSSVFERLKLRDIRWKEPWVDSVEISVRKRSSYQ